MKSLACAVLAVAVLACANETARPEAEPSPSRQAAPQAIAPPGIGDVAPDFTLTDHTGASVTLSESRGQKVILVFYRGHW